MAEKAKVKDNKKKTKIGAIIGLCALIVIIVVVVIVAVVLTKKNTLNDDFFVTDDTKISITYENDGENSESLPQKKSHLVYFYNGNDEVTDMKAYYEFADAEAAKQAYELFKENGDPESYKDISVEGAYVIITANESEYANQKASTIKREIELQEIMNNAEDEDDGSAEE